MATPAPATFARLLEQAVNEPGILSDAYRQFHGYSVGNQLLALTQCLTRDIKPGPIATFQGWKDVGRYVRRGEKALTLCQPVTVQRTTTSPDGGDETQQATWFVYRASWFVLAQTDGPPFPEPSSPAWDCERALTSLDVVEIPFDHTDGNCLGFARERTIAINPVNAMPHKTRFHELAHVVLGHTSEGLHADDDRTPRNLRECEAEAVALVCLAALELPGVEYSRGYIQHWWGRGNPIPEPSARRILRAADQILKAGVR
ncbi:MAG: ImmA/IrrE family metallo-endopeptidase [Vicinamibacterales bacterium]